ncbi:hypothetical protein [Microvirga flavescens]|uniref:hypothetical protein n=1 Tax=Microvirga flavescens TaxID=2249811 RepID=UPI000DDBF0FF|nr:hypothetical protein [Microvirga flavescens]
MIGEVLGLLAFTLVNALVSGLAAWNGMEILIRSAFFGRDHEGGKALGGIIVIFPGLWFFLFLLLFVVRDWPGAGLLDGWWAFAYAIGAFLINCTLFFAWLLTRR